jgi:electron transport complex protein RnfG
MNATLRETFSTSVTLLVFAVICASLLSGVYVSTRPTIERSEQAEKMRLIDQTLPPNSFDNDPVRDARPLPTDPLLGLKHPGQAYVAAKAGSVTAVALEAVAPDGYGGEIKLLVGIDAGGSITGVRVVSHHETPGLGDYIDIAKSNWINIFVGKRLDDPPAAAWRVRKDGGQFDYMAGATITPRAVIKAVHKALSYFAEHKAELLRSIAQTGAGSEAARAQSAVPSPQPSPPGGEGKREEPTS